MSGANVIGGALLFGHATHRRVLVDPGLPHCVEVEDEVGTWHDVCGSSHNSARRHGFAWLRGVGPGSLHAR